MTDSVVNQLFPGRTFISTVLETLDTKTRMSGDLLRRYLQRAGMAGFIIGVFYAADYSLVAAFTSIPAGTESLAPFGRMIGAATFGWALVFIYFTKSELLTSNMMIVSVGAYHHRIGWSKAMRLLTFCYLGNVVGGLVLAVLLRFSSILEGGTLVAMAESVDHKLSYLTEGVAGWGDLFVRAVLCNFMINLAMLMVYNGLVKDTVTKCLVMVVSVFIFAFLGLEHSVANTVLFSIVGLQEGIDLGPAAGNVAIALVGNFVGGGLLIGLYYAYVNDHSRYLREHPELR
jgi:formate/nitrite transporter FocA (FNT family)